MVSDADARAAAMRPPLAHPSPQNAVAAAAAAAIHAGLQRLPAGTVTTYHWVRREPPAPAGAPGAPAAEPPADAAPKPALAAHAGAQRCAAGAADGGPGAVAR
ncbi:unnamed protein product, partial [Prorocentrum cordatum]